MGMGALPLERRRRGAGRIQIVVTPGSGDGRALRTARRLEAALRARGHRVALRSFDDLVALRRWGRTASGSTLLVAVGGDSTLSTAAEVAMRAGTPLLPVPSGFGNLFTRVLGHDDRIEAVCGLVAEGRAVRVDVGVEGAALFLCGEHFGLLSEIQQSVENRPSRPRAKGRRYLAYCWAALRRLREAPLPALEVVADGRLVAREAAVVTVANVPLYGAWLQLTPDASPVDGLLDVFVLEGRSKAAILARLLAHHLRLPGVKLGGRLRRARHVSVRAAGAAPRELRVRPGQLRVLCSAARIAALGRRPGGLPGPGRPGRPATAARSRLVSA
jgi:diacylglycerol kinase (ATP)